MNRRRLNKRPADMSDDDSQPKRQDTDPSRTPPEDANQSPDDIPGTSALQSISSNLESRLTVVPIEYSQIEESEYNDGGYLRVSPGKVYGGIHKVVKYLNRGHFASAWLSKRTDNGKYEVPKVSKSAVKYRNSVLKEIKLLNSFESIQPHPNIVKLLGDFETSNGQFSHVTMVLEVMGPNLEYAIHSSGKKMHLEVVRRVAKQLLEALKYIHNFEIIHMDIKPANIMLAITDADVARLAANVDPSHESYDIDITNPSANIVVKLADFGNRYDKTKPPSIRVAPTCPYRGPETFLTAVVDTCTDMWSMGCVLFEMVVGQLLFDCDLHRTVEHPLVHFIMMNSMVGPVPRAPYEGNLRPHVINMFGEDGNIRMPPGTMAGSAFVAIALLNNLNFDDANDFSELMHKFLNYDMKERVTAEEALTDKFLLPNGGKTPSGQEMVRQNRSQESSNSPSSGWNLHAGSSIAEEEPSTSYAGEQQKPEDGPSHSGQDF